MRCGVTGEARHIDRYPDIVLGSRRPSSKLLLHLIAVGLRRSCCALFSLHQSASRFPILRNGVAAEQQIVVTRRRSDVTTNAEDQVRQVRISLAVTGDTIEQPMRQQLNLRL